MPPVAQPFPLEQVRLLPGPFRRAMELDERYLLSLDPERLLHNFRVNAGLPSTAKPLGGWEEPKCELRGHFVGHYLSACALMYAATGKGEFKDRSAYVTGELAKCQVALKSGYLSAFPEEFIDRVEEQKKRVWAPWYTLHKILAGLLDVHEHCANAQALQVARRFADWIVARTGRLTDDQMQKMLRTEHGGMNEGLANLYALAGDEKYLEVALRFDHRAVLDPAAERRDRLTGLHANTQIPKFIGAARLYELTGRPELKTAAEFFWTSVVKERSYVIGGHSDNEAFTPKEHLSQALSSSTTETCNTYNMLKLTRHLFGWHPSAELADYYERALFNHILASQNPHTGMMCYYVPLRPGSHKVYNTPLASFWCCTGTGVENHAKYGDSIYFHEGPDKLYWNLFIASELDWKGPGVKLRQETSFPDEGRSRLTIACAKPTRIALQIRRPAWAEDGFSIAVNGRQVPTDSKPGAYALVERTWNDGDSVEVTLPMSLSTESFRDNPHRLAILHGPLVLSAEIDPARPAPAIVAGDRAFLDTLKPAGKPNTFISAPATFRVLGEDQGRSITLEPFYQMDDDRAYAVYFDVFTPRQWQDRQEDYEQEARRQKDLESRTVDFVQPGDDRSERHHEWKGESTESGAFNGRRWRHANDDGWFAYTLKVLPGHPQKLHVTYWGSDAGGRRFDVLVNGTRIATQTLEHNRPDRFYDEVYPIPASLLQGKKKIEVRFAPHPRAMAGGVFGIRIVRDKQP